MSLSDDFGRLFDGRTDAHGINAGGVVRSAPDFARHLTGENPIGVFPLRDDGTVMFAAIDLDQPRLDLAVQIRGLLPQPVWIEQSRSGNFHVWVFFSEPIEAWVPRAIFKEILGALGLSGIEIFPKQDRLRPDMLGNYINLPYAGETRKVLHGAGGFFSADEFVERALATRQSPDTWRRRAEFLGLREPSAERAEGTGTTSVLHVCAEKIIRERETNPVVKGHRHVVYFNLAKQLRAYEGFSDDEAWYYLNLVNDAGEPPLPKSELRQAFNNAASYRSTGCDHDLMRDYVSTDCPILRREREHGSRLEV